MTSLKGARWPHSVPSSEVPLQYTLAVYMRHTLVYYIRAVYCRQKVPSLFFFATFFLIIYS